MKLDNRVWPIRIVLVETSLPENIGSAARAMKTMGLSDLALVRPRNFPHVQATALAAGADDILESARVVDSLDQAIGDCWFAAGCTARTRDVALPMLEPNAAATRLLEECARGPVALLFGAERTGLTNAELSRCSVAVHIPTDPSFSSLNLAQAVQVLCYELRRNALGQNDPMPAVEAPADPPASIDDMERFFVHLEQTMGEIDFLKGRSPDILMQRLRRLFHRAEPDRREIHILRGILSEAQRQAGLAMAARNSAQMP